MELLSNQQPEETALWQARRAATVGVRRIGQERNPPVETAAEIAALVGCNPRTMQSWLAGGWTLAGIANTARALGVEVWEVFRAGTERHTHSEEADHGD